jgi:two-component system sensor histidine kinase KdpD
MNSYKNADVRRRLLGSIVGVACAVLLGAALLPFRSHISVSTAALLLVIPVVLGVVIGGFVAGVVSVAAGFLVYDYAYIPPYRTLNVGTAQNWTALIVYVVVMLLVAQVVSRVDAARSQAQRSTEATRRLFEISELLVADHSVSDLLKTIVQTAQKMFDVPGVSLLVLENGQLTVAATAGEPLTADELHRLDPQSGVPVSVGTAPSFLDELRTIALSASGRPVGILAMRSRTVSHIDRAVLNTFANDAALALERAQLREQALRTQLLEEVDRLRHGLMGAISHDLRTPLATIKVASSTLSNRSGQLSEADVYELHHLIEIEADRLTRLVTNLLDMTRIEAGVFEVHRTPTSLTRLVQDAVRALGPTWKERRIEVLVPDSLGAVNVDPLIMGQVLINLLDNADRYSPSDGTIEVKGERRGDVVTLSVSDQGPGVAAENRATVFDRFAHFDTGGRAGLGLTIAKTFVEAHGERIWYEEVPEGGARFVFSLGDVVDAETGD